MASIECRPISDASSDDTQWIDLAQVISSLYTADSVLSLPRMEFVFIVQFLLSLIALSLMLALALRLLIRSETECTRQRLLLTTSTRILMLSLVAALFTANIGVLLSSLYHLQVFFVRERSTWCYWLSFTFSDCQFMKTIGNVATLVVYSSSMASAVDRCVGAILLDASVARRLRTALAILIVCLQWAGSIALMTIYFGANRSATAAIEKPSQIPPYYAHCAAHIPLPTQRYPTYYAILTWQVMAMAPYMMLIYHHSTPLVINELKHALTSRNFGKTSAIYESIVGTEYNLPTVSLIVSYFVLNMVLDRNFVLTLTALISRRTIDVPTHNQLRDLIVVARWTEFQTFLGPLLSLAIFVILRAQLNSFASQHQSDHLTHNDEDNFIIEALDAAVYERVGSESGDATSSCSSTTASVTMSKHTCRLDPASAAIAAAKVKELQQGGKLPPPAPPLPPSIFGWKKTNESEPDDKNPNKSKPKINEKECDEKARDQKEENEDEEEDNYQDASDV